MFLTFLDASVLIAAHRGATRERELALALVNDRNRSFVASPFLYLETVPKAVHLKNESEVSFYRAYFEHKVQQWVGDVVSIVTVALREAERCGLAAMDALHVAASHLAEAQELVTLERPVKPIYRTKLVRVVHLDSPAPSADSN